MLCATQNAPRTFQPPAACPPSTHCTCPRLYVGKRETPLVWKTLVDTWGWKDGWSSPGELCAMSMNTITREANTKCTWNCGCPPAEMGSVVRAGRGSTWYWMDVKWSRTRQNQEMVCECVYFSQCAMAVFAYYYRAQFISAGKCLIILGYPGHAGFWIVVACFG